MSVEVIKGEESEWIEKLWEEGNDRDKKRKIEDMLKKKPVTELCRYTRRFEEMAKSGKEEIKEYEKMKYGE